MRKFWLVAIVMGIDQAVKWWWLKQGVAVVNYGVAFGLGASDMWWVVVGAIVAYLWWSKRGWQWNLIIGGGMSNLVDRLVRGGVVDGWWGFNLADVVIVTGSIWLIARPK